MAVCKPFFLRAADLSQHPSGLVTASVSPVTASVWPVTAPVRPAQHPSRLSQTHLAWHSIRPARHNTRLTRHNARGVRVSDTALYSRMSLLARISGAGTTPWSTKPPLRASGPPEAVTFDAAGTTTTNP